MKQGVIETIVGFVVIVIALWFFAYAYNTSNSAKPSSGYMLYANFENIDGLNVGSDVRISGIKVGYIENITLDNESFFATVNMRVDQNIKIPEDSRAIVSTTGFIGNKYIRVNPGAADKTLKDGSKFRHTQGALNIEDLVSKLLYSVTAK